MSYRRRSAPRPSDKLCRGGHKRVTSLKNLRYRNPIHKDDWFVLDTGSKKKHREQACYDNFGVLFIARNGGMAKFTNYTVYRTPKPPRLLWQDPKPSQRPWHGLTRTESVDTIGMNFLELHPYEGCPKEIQVLQRIQEIDLTPADTISDVIDKVAYHHKTWMVAGSHDLRCYGTVVERQSRLVDLMDKRPEGYWFNPAVFLITPVDICKGG